MAFVTKLSICTLLILSFYSMAFCVKLCSLDFVECGGSQNGKLYKMQVNTTCTPGGKEAFLKKGTKVQINFTFSATHEETTLTSSVHGILGVIPIPFPLGNPDGCKDSGLTCPIKANKQYNLLSILDIKSAYPPIQVEVKWELKDKSGNNIFCMKVPVKIVS